MAVVGTYRFIKILQLHLADRARAHFSLNIFYTRTVVQILVRIYLKVDFLLLFLALPRPISKLFPYKLVFFFYIVKIRVFIIIGIIRGGSYQWLGCGFGSVSCSHYCIHLRCLVRHIPGGTCAFLKFPICFHVILAV
jgi:hypothetical protein